MNEESIIVVDQRGLRGRINDTEFAPERDSEVRIRFSGHQIVVPAEMLVMQEDGTFSLPLSFAALVEADEQGSQQGDESLIFPVIEEELLVKKREVENGVRVTKVVHEQPKQVELPLISEEIEVQRIPINRSVAQPMPMRQEGDVLIISVLEEVLVVQKQWLIKEEVHIITKRTERLQAIQETLRREEILVKPIQNAASEETSDHPVRAEGDEERHNT